MGSPVDDALDRLDACIVKLSGYEQGPEPWLSPQGQADIATVRSALQQLREERDAAWATQGRYFREALDAEAEVRRLTEGLLAMEAAQEYDANGNLYFVHGKRTREMARALLSASPSDGGGAAEDAAWEKRSRER